VVVSTPQAALADAKKGVSMFLSEAINVPVLGIIGLFYARRVT
jgi:ATP-binding protein involved in chromosome partitioning